jgi:rhomboid protease GluP
MGFIALMVLLGAAWYFTTPKERDRFRRAVLGGADQAMSGASHYWPARQPFDDALDARTRRPVVTLAIVALNVGIFMSMVMGSGSLSDPDTIVRWGGSIGTRTANGEWWRLATAMFVHAGFFQVVANVAGLVQIGLITERFFGRFAMASAFAGASLLFAVLGLLLHPVAVTAGGSAGVFAVYGLFVVMLVTGVASPSPFTIPATTLLKVAPSAALFVLYSVAAGHAGALELSGLAVGLAYGFLLAKPAVVETPSLRRTASLTAAIAVIVITAGIPMRGVIDVRPEISRITEIEERTANAYDSAVRRFTIGELTLKELVAVIDRTILPELRSAQDRLKRLQHVPREQAPLVARADEYFRLREESWQARAAGLRRTSLKGLRSPDDTERQAREVLDDLRVQNP